MARPTPPALSSPQGQGGGSGAARRGRMEQVGDFGSSRPRLARLRRTEAALLLSAGLLLGLTPGSAIASLAGGTASLNAPHATSEAAPHGPTSPPARPHPAGVAPTVATSPPARQASPAARSSAGALAAAAPPAFPNQADPSSDQSSAAASPAPPRRLSREDPQPGSSRVTPTIANADTDRGTRSGAPTVDPSEATIPPSEATVPPDAPAAGATLPVWPSLTELLALPGWINLTLSINAAPIANPIGGLSSAANWMQQNELNLTAGTGLERDPSQWHREIDHWQARLRVDLYNGQPTFSDTVGSLFALQTMAYAPGWYLSGLSVLRSSRDQSLQISAGYQSVDQDFLVAPPFTSYLYSGINDTLNLTIAGLPITPFAAPSLVMRWRSPGFGSWSVGAYWLDQQTELAGLFGGPPAFSQDLRGSLQALQWDLPLGRREAGLKQPIALRNGGRVARQLPAPLLQLGGFRSDTRFFAASDSPTGRSPLLNHVAYGSLTLPARLPLGLDNRLWGTVQWGLNPSQNITPLFLAGGWQCQGPFPGRPLDVLSLGVGRTGFSPQLLPQLSWAGAVELNYTVQISNRLSLQPVIQWILRPSGDGTVPAIVTTALQLNLSL